MVVQESMSVEKKLGILADAAKYDVACTSSGMERAGKKGELGNSIAAGICHSFSSDGRCISLLKVLFTNECIFDCKYCINRSSNDVLRASFTPKELCELTIGFYKRNYIEGLFLSSGILHTPDYTMQLIGQTLRMLREEYHFRGYIHCKAIPGADPSLIEYAGWYADRMSVNLELPTNEGLRRLAPNKTRKNILTPMRQIQSGISESRMLLGMQGGNRSAYQFTAQAAEKAGIAKRFGYDPGLEQKETGTALTESDAQSLTCTAEDSLARLPERGQPNQGTRACASLPAEQTGKTLLTQPPLSNGAQPLSSRPSSPCLQKKMEPVRTAGLSLQREVGIPAGRGFAAAGQSTQMIIGATKETDYQLVSVAEALYRRFDLKRVFYSAFVNVNQDASLPMAAGGASLLREHRLYQADFLLRYYGFRAGELLNEKNPNFNPVLDPKCDWAVRHLEYFPVEVMKADYFLLLRVPGIGAKSAARIIEARRYGHLSFDILKKMGVVLKRAQYFITCDGAALGSFSMNEGYITGQLMLGERLPKNLQESINGRQMTLFDFPDFASAG